MKLRDIKMTMDTNMPGRLPFSKKPVLDESLLSKDMENIQTYYQANGYFDAAASYVVVRGQRSGARVIITVTEGLPSRVENVSIETAAPNDNLTAALGELVTLKRGARFQYEFYQTSKNAMQKYLADNGYGSGEVAGTIYVNKGGRTVRVVFRVSEGLLQRFGPVTVSRNTTVREIHIANEMDFSSDEVFSSAKVDQSRVNVYNLNLFRSVSVVPAISSSSAVVPVRVDVIEGDKRQIKLGIGYAPEEKFRASAQWSRYYLWGRPRTLTIGASYSSIEEHVTGKILQPYFINRKNSVSVTGAQDREKYTSYTNEKISSQFQVTRSFRPGFSAFAAYNLEVNRPVNLNDSLAEEILAATAGSSYFISGIISGLNYAFVDNPAYPSHGFTTSLYLEPATATLGSKVDYLKGVMEAHLYGLLYRDIVIAMRCKAGFIRPYRFTTSIPIFKRFFSGGSYSVRGYGFQQLGPRDPDGTPLGGQYIFEDSLEIRYPIYNKFKGVVFVDAGDVYASSFALNARTLNYGIGVGIRYVTPVGPLGIDLAFPAPQMAYIDYGSFSVYVTIGQGF